MFYIYLLNLCFAMDHAQSIVEDLRKNDNSNFETMQSNLEGETSALITQVSDDMLASIDKLRDRVLMLVSSNNNHRINIFNIIQNNIKTTLDETVQVVQSSNLDAPDIMKIAAKISDLSESKIFQYDRQQSYFPQENTEQEQNTQSIYEEDTIKQKTISKTPKKEEKIVSSKENIITLDKKPVKKVSFHPMPNFSDANISSNLNMRVQNKPNIAPQQTAPQAQQTPKTNIAPQPQVAPQAQQTPKPNIVAQPQVAQQQTAPQTQIAPQQTAPQTQIAPQQTAPQAQQTPSTSMTGAQPIQNEVDDLQGIAMIEDINNYLNEAN